MKKILFLLITICLLANVSMASDPHLIGWWKMAGPTDGESVRFVRDYSGNGHHGTIGSSDTWMGNGGIDFDGGSWGASGIVFENNGADIGAHEKQ